ncbi:MAG: hypothetical protein ACK5WZ_10835 [Pseudobdellovibrionaceae bacterium]
MGFAPPKTGQTWWDWTHHFYEKRARRLSVQLDDLSSLNFTSPITCPIKEVSYYKIVKTSYTKPLSSIGSVQANSRFNFKNIDELATRVVYFGQDKPCCYAEKFHLDIQKYNYSQLIKRSEEEKMFEFEFEPHEIHEYKVTIDNILVLTSDASYKALGIPDRVVKDEWYSVNDDFEIPTAKQYTYRQDSIDLMEDADFFQDVLAAIRYYHFVVFAR